ncbi:MAG: hypothetical protein ACTHJW_06935 [Streptosporangiaceae bacterium]
MADFGHEGQNSARTGAASAGRVSRRAVITSSAVTTSAVAAGMALPGVTAEADTATGGLAVSLGKPGAMTVEFRSRVVQSGAAGQSFTSFGYLIRASHAKRAGLFHGTPLSEATALLTAYATGDLHARTVDVSVHSLDIIGTLTVFQRKHPGASFDHPMSFRVGTPVARYDIRLQDVLTVFATDTGLPTLTGDMLQTAAHALSGPLAGRTFGRRGTRLRFFATGLGHRTDPAPHAELEIAGNWSIE